MHVKPQTKKAHRVILTKKKQWVAWISENTTVLEAVDIHMHLTYVVRFAYLSLQKFGSAWALDNYARTMASYPTSPWFIKKQNSNCLMIGSVDKSDWGFHPPRCSTFLIFIADIRKRCENWLFYIFFYSHSFVFVCENQFSRTICLHKLNFS